MNVLNSLVLPLAFVGHPQAVIEAALAAGRSAYNLIDMTRHSGEHPRIGAMVNIEFSFTLHHQFESFSSVF